MAGMRTKRLGESPLRRRARRLEGALRTGPVAHLAGGALDVLQALARYGWARARGRRVR